MTSCIILCFSNYKTIIDLTPIDTPLCSEIGEKLHKSKLIIRVFNAAFAAGSEPAEENVLANIKTIIDLTPEDTAAMAILKSQFGPFEDFTFCYGPTLVSERWCPFQN